jgi:ribosome-associated heat shock protein Hsp15
MIPKSGNRFSEKIMRKCNMLGTHFDSRQTDPALKRCPGNLDRQRIDKWLWHARVVRTRSAAAALASAGLVRINGIRIDAASRAVRPGDVITVVLDRGVRVLKVVEFAARRVSSESARGLYQELSLEAKPAPGLARSLAKAPSKR